MKKFMTLILISALALVLTQCTVIPTERAHDNAFSIWAGVTGPIDSDDGKKEKKTKMTYVVGTGIKHYNPKFILINSFFNANTGIHFGRDYGISLDGGLNFATDDLVNSLDGGGNGSAAVQLYAGPSIGAALISKNGKSLRFNPTLGISGGLSMRSHEPGEPPEGDFSMEGVMHINMKDLFKITKADKNSSDKEAEPGLLIARLMLNIYKQDLF